MRFLSSSALLALLLTSSLSALPSLDSRLSQLETQMEEVSGKTVYGNQGAKTASAFPKLRTYGAFVSIEGLYLKFFEGGLDCAYRNTSTATINPMIGSTKSLDFDWEFAFRVAAGYQFKSPDWAVWAEYFRFTTDQSSSKRPPSPGTLFSNIFEGVGPLSYAKEKMDISFNTVDLNLGRSYLLRNSFSLSPFFGIRGAMIHQHQTESLTLLNNTTRTMKQTNECNALGLRSGSQVRWNLGAGWSFFGSAAAALMLGQFDNSAQSNSGPTVVSLLDLNTTNHRLLPTLSSDAGVRWERTFASDRTRMVLALAYEFDYWWRQNQTIHMNISGADTYYRWSEDLGWQAVKLTCAFDF